MSPTAGKMMRRSTLIILSSLLVFGVNADDEIDLRDLTKGDPFFYTSDQYITEDDGQKELLGVGRPDRTHSQVPHLPVYYGYMSTNYTYRFVNVMEQVFTMIGEGKHGLWRVQENGTVREYLRKGAQGLPEGADIFSEENLEIIKNQYSHFLPEEGFSGYKYPDERLNHKGRLNYIDLPIDHPKYQGRYTDLPPIDLPNFYCTMSGPDYPYAKQVMNFAFNQPGANEIGPLGIRAGLAVKENYPNVLRLNHFPDARSWVNTGQEGKDEYHVKWEPIDTSKTNAEYYLVERPFFNKPYLFLVAIYNNVDNDDFQYVRPDGHYYESLRDRGLELKTSVTQWPIFHLENGEQKPAVGLPLYGVHHPNREAFGGGGACPLKGGDWGRYPETSGGAGWPTNYEEVTPLCDAVLIDIKFYSNLDGRDWNDPDKYLANAGHGTKTVTYTVRPGDYGVFTDPYNTERGIVNPERQYVPGTVTLTYPSVGAPVGYTEVPDVVGPKEGMTPIGTSCRHIPDLRWTPPAGRHPAAQKMQRE